MSSTLCESLEDSDAGMVINMTEILDIVGCLWLKNPTYFVVPLFIVGACGGVVVEALCYKLAGRGFDSRWCHWNWNFSVT
jgi:hypothetical protein